MLKSDDGGLTWPVVKSGSSSGRPLYVATNFPMDQVSSHFDVYFAGQQATCSSAGTGPHCPTDPAKWNFIPNSSLNHDINGIAFNPIPFANNYARCTWSPTSASTKWGLPRRLYLAGDPARLDDRRQRGCRNRRLAGLSIDGPG